MKKGVLCRGVVRSPDLKELRLIPYREEQGRVMEGVLQDPDGFWYPIVNGVPCFLRGLLRPGFETFRKKHGLPFLEESRENEEVAIQQSRTTETFSDKWRRFRNYGLEPGHQDFLLGWYCKKLGVGSHEELKDFYRSKELILEVGPGSGFNTKFMAENTKGSVFALDVSEAAFTTFENTRHLANCQVFQADLMEAPFADEVFDFIIADGVLHHTPDTNLALQALYRKLKPDGQLFFYVYRKMGAVRQFCDRHVRRTFSKLDPERCYEACEAITELGRELSRLNAEINLTKPIPILGIPAGKHNVQRLVYYNFLKCFWNEAFDFETNNMVNFDWYHPHNAWQHTQEEVEGWLKELDIKEYSFNNSNPNGISVLLRKPST